MSSRSSCSFGMRFSFVCSAVFFLIASSTVSLPATAQTTQPFLFAGTYNASNNSYGLATLLRNSTTGALTLLPNTVVSFKDPCVPSTIDPTGNFLFGVCGEGVAMYTLDPSTGLVAETSTSPYAASVSTGQTGVLVAAESTGQYVYLLKVGFAQSPIPSTFSLDTFQIDSTTPALVPINSQSLPFNATWVASVADPAHHGIFVFVNQEQSGSSPAALLFPVSFDFLTGAATVPSTGMTIGENARSLAISPSGGYVALGWGDAMGSLTVYQISSSNFSMSPVANPVNLGPEDSSYGSYSFPDSIFFSPGGNLLYVQAPPVSFSGGGLPFLVFDPSTATQLSAPPIQLSNASFLDGLMDPQAPFSYVGNSGPTYGISVYQVDLSTGSPSQPAPISSPFFPQMDLSPLFVSVEQGGQGIQGPTLGANPDALTFNTITGQTSPAQFITLKSLGAQSVSFTSIQISGANAADFAETDTCASSPVLPTNHTCTISVTYSSTAIGASQATLFITDNAAGSPQFIPLSGTAAAPPPNSPAVTLNPASTLTFPGTATQGTTSAPQTVTVTNSGGAPLQIMSAVLTGFNSSDFSVSADTCSGSIAANASCTISIVFSPTAAGVRTTTLTITDNAANSPQSLTISGTASAAVSITPASGSSTTATLTAGQTAQFKLQATPGAGFTGTLSLSCSGAPFGATCTVPATLNVSNGNPVSFTVTITTLAASQLTPSSRFPNSPIHIRWPWFTLALLALALLLLHLTYSPERFRFALGASPALATAFSLLLIFSGIGCGGGGGSSSGGSSQTAPPPPNSQTAATPTIQPAGGTFSSPQTVSITDSTAASTVYYTTDGSTPTSSSPVYSAPFALNSATKVQAIASASAYTNSAVATSTFKFRTGAGTYPITISVTATPTGSSKSLQLDPISLTLIVN
jgi:Chitobiase/beta-hexosaminidase C-terminal domain/Abnormal spindle-like microcephaly-assoc'd, ASPM-SPD-2-Hydin